MGEQRVVRVEKYRFGVLECGHRIPLGEMGVPYSVECEACRFQRAITGKIKALESELAMMLWAQQAMEESDG
jgi:hypothetical protein